MVTIRCTVYEKHAFLKLIEYAKQKKYKENEEGKINSKLLELELKTLEKLKNRVNGIYKEDYQETPAKAYRRTIKRSEDDMDPHKIYMSSLM